MPELSQHPLAERAYRELYPDKPLRRQLLLRFSGKFKGYNATILSATGRLEFALSKNFKEVSEEIKIGVMQHLLNRLNKTRVKTLELELYQSFLKKLTDYSEVNNVAEELRVRFEQLNKEYFDGFMMLPNLKWGSYSLTKLGHYEFDTDTISVSTALQEDDDLLDYVLYHEMLHKKHKFSETPGGVTRTHTAAFKKDEQKFRLKDAEKRLGTFIRERKRGRGRQQARSPIRKRKSFLGTLRDFF